MMEQNQQIAEYSKTEAELSKLKEKCATTVYDIKTPQGMKTAVSLRAEIRTNRTGIEAVRKEVKAPIITLGKLIDSEAERLTNELLALEKPIDTLIKAEEKRKDDEKKAEKDRKTKVNAFFDEMKQVVIDCIGKDSYFIKEKHDYVDSAVISESFFLSQFNDACTAKGETLTILGDMCLDTEKREIEAQEALEKAEKIKAAILAKMTVFNVSQQDISSLESIAEKRVQIESTVVDVFYGEFEQQANDAKKKSLGELFFAEKGIKDRLAEKTEQLEKLKAEPEPEPPKDYESWQDYANNPKGDSKPDCELEPDAIRPLNNENRYSEFMRILEEVYGVVCLPNDVDYLVDKARQIIEIDNAIIPRAEHERLLWLTTPKPIETAPHDLEVIVVTEHGYRFDEFLSDINRWKCEWSDATHWQPLPSHVMPIQQTQKPLDDKPDPMGR